MRRTAGVAAAGVLGAALLAAPLGGPPTVASPPFTVVESRSVVLAPGLEVRLGDRVEDLPGEVSLQAYHPGRGEGTGQWWGPSGSPVLVLLSGGVVRAISVAYEPAFRTRRGVALGDPAGSVRRVYAGRVRDGRVLAGGYSLAPGLALLGPGDGVTYFDTACTGRVNAIGLALGEEGLRVLGGLWAPPDPLDPCAPVD